MALRAGFGDRDAVVNRCGIKLSEPDGSSKGIFLLNGTKLPDFDLVSGYLRDRYVIVLTHHWKILDYILAEYRKRAGQFDCVVSPNGEFDRILDFAPPFRSNTVDLLVDENQWPRLKLDRDIDVVDSVSVPWALKQPLKWLDEVQRYLDRQGSGRAVYLMKREPGVKEDEECRLLFREFKRKVAEDKRIELCIGVEQSEMVNVYNRAKIIYHPSNSEFGCRAILEAMYCGARPVLEPYDWAKAAAIDGNIMSEIRVQGGLNPFPEAGMPDIRQWLTAGGLREKLAAFLACSHKVNTRITSFTMFSHVYIDTATGRRVEM